MEEIMSTVIGGFDEENDGQEVDNFRKAIARKIALESDRLVDELFAIVYDEEVDAKVKLSAITILLDRGIPKLGVQHAKEEELEERGSRKAIREEIEKLLLGTEDPEDKETG
jgi:hypothetical protein